MGDETRLAAYRFVAYSAVTFSVIAVVSICLTLPMVYNYIHHVKRSMKTEIHYCKVRFPGKKGSVTLLHHATFCRVPLRASGAR